ncbi:MAG: T9SS type A sorting domain-containing protein [Bacteroidales bacterium]
MKKILTFLILLPLLISGAYAQENIMEWVRHVSSPNLLFGEGVSTDDEGNAIITGYFNTYLALFGDTLIVESDRNSMFLAKVSPENELIWFVTAEADGNQGVTGFKTVYKNGYIYQIGDYRGTATFGSVDFAEITLPGSDYRSMYIARYTTDGLLEWVKPVTTSNSLGLVLTGGTHDLVVDDYGGVYVSTQFRNSLNFAGVSIEDPTPGENLFNALVAKLDANGAYQWHWTSVNSGSDQAQGMALKNNESLFFTVRYADSLTVDNHIASSPGFAVVEFDLDGNYLWHQFMVTSASLSTGVRCFSVDFDEDENLYLAGSYRTDILWDQETGLPVENPVRSDGFIIKIDGNTRQWLWGKALGNPEENDDIKSIAYTSAGNFMLGGNFKGVMELNDELTLTSHEESVDGFWAQMDTEGDILMGESFGGSSGETVAQLALHDNDEAFIIGRFQNDFQYYSDELLFSSWGSFDVFLVKIGIVPSAVELDYIAINGEPLEGFEPETTQYSVMLPWDTQDVPQVSAGAAHPQSNVEIEQAVSITGTEAERTATITVTSEDETESQDYILTFGVSSGDATLSSLEVDDMPLADFQPDNLAYEVAFPDSVTDVPVVTATANDVNATVQIQQANSLTGDEEQRTATITVTAQDPDVLLEYTVTFRYIGTDATLAEINLDGEPVENFDPETEMYHVKVLSFDNLPLIEAVPADANASVVISDPESSTGGDEVFMLVHILVTAEDNETTRDYYLRFREVSSNALLNLIQVDEEDLAGFDPQIFDYILDWENGDGSLPFVDALPQSEDADVLITQVVSLEGTQEERTAEILVIAEDGETTNTYTVFFDVSADVPLRKQAMVNIFPNPARGSITINSQLMTGEMVITNATGKVVQKGLLPSNQFTLDISEYPVGVYVIQISGKNHATVETGIFIKK